MCRFFHHEVGDRGFQGLFGGCIRPVITRNVYMAGDPEKDNLFIYSYLRRIWRIKG